jgi:hypothetical protein
MVLTEEEWQEWKTNSITKEFFKALIKERETVKEQLVMGLYEEEGLARGVAKCLKDLTDMTYNDFREAAYE